MNTEYIIVGDGYAAMFFAHQLIRNNKKFLLFSDASVNASKISAGIINPVVLKKFTTFWKAQEQIDFLNKTLSDIEIYTGKNYLLNQPIHRIFHDEIEKKLWLKKADNPELESFLGKDFTRVKNIYNPFETGEVLQSARLNVSGFFSDFFLYLERNGFLVKDKFHYDKLFPQKKIYNDIEYEKIIFCEGMGVKQNPFFSEIPVQQNKGHQLTVKLSENLDDKLTLKKKHFLFPLNDEYFYYGGTYDRDQTDNKIDENAKKQLIDGLSEIYSKPFEVSEINFGFRPTVDDRRPILGNHHQYSNLYVFNGLGARGILNGCYFANHLYQHIEHNNPLLPEVDVKRFN